MSQEKKDKLRDEMQHHFDHAIVPPDAPDFDPELLGDEVRQTFLSVPFLPYYLEPYENETDPVAAMKEHFEDEGYTVVVHPDRLTISKEWDKTEVPKAKQRAKDRQKARKERHDQRLQEAKDRGEDGISG